MSKRKVTHEQWEDAIREARQYTANYDKVRWKIVEICLRVCDASHGGRKVDTVFSISKFAAEIELNRKTLYEWIRVKRIVLDKLPKKIQDAPHKYAYADFQDCAEQVAEEETEQEVYRRFKEITDSSPDSRRFKRYIKGLNSILYNCKRPMLMKDVERVVIDEILEKSSLIVALLNKEIELRDKFAGERADAVRLNIKEEIARGVL